VPDALYVQSAELNGHTHTKNWIGFQDIAKGGTLRISVGPTENMQWGSAPADTPPSLSNSR
jgi:putative alpha-1,2-mannosidase